MGQKVCPTTEDTTENNTFFVQSSPCVRLQPPSTQRLTLPHCDSMYGHQPGQINFWLVLNETDGSVGGGNSLFSESFPGRGDFKSFDVNRGQVMRFYGNKCLHFTEPNKTEYTRVSLDFRVVPGRWFDPDYWGSRDPQGRQKFKFQVAYGKPEEYQAYYTKIEM